MAHVKSRQLVLAAMSMSLLVGLLSGCSKSSSDYVAEGKVFLEKGDLNAAVISLKNAVQTDPADAQGRFALAEALERNGDLQGAEQQLRRVLEQGGNADDLIPRIGVLLLDRSENALLIRDFGKRELKSPAADADLRAQLALAHVGLGQVNDARTQLSRAKEKTAAIHLANAQINFAEGKRTEAAAEMAEVLKSDKAPWWVTRAASRAFVATGSQDQALDAIKRAYDAAPMHRGVIGEYAELLIAANHRADAKGLLDKLRKLAPTYYRTQYLDALFLLEEGKVDQAYTAATKVLAALPNHLQSQIIAANIELDRNELSSVESRLKKIQLASPDSLEGYRLRAELEMRRGNIPAASAALEKALRRVPGDRGLLVLSANVAWSKGDKGTAITQMRQATEKEPPRAELLARLAEMLSGAGQIAEAQKALDRSIALASDARATGVVFNTAVRMKEVGRARALAEAEASKRPKDPEPQLWRAVVMGMSGDEAGAYAQTLHILDLQPDYYPALRGLALGAAAAERRDEYGRRLQKAVDVGSRDARVYFDRIQFSRRTGKDIDKIGTVFDKGLVALPESISLRDAAVRYWISQGAKDKILAVAKDGEARLPDSPEMAVLVAQSNEAVGNLEQAVAQYAKLATRYPERVDWGMRQAEVLIRVGKKPDAMDVLKKLVNQRPDEPAPYSMLAGLQVSQGLAKDAEVTATMLRDRPRLTAAGALLLGDVYARTDRKPEAIKAYIEAAKAGEEEAALIHKVALLDRTNGQGVATGELETWLAAHPKDITVRSFAARREVARKDFAKAIRHFELLLGILPNAPGVANELAWLYLETQNPKALAMAEKAVGQAPDNPLILDTLGMAQIGAGKMADGIATLRTAVELAPTVLIVRLHLGEALLADGKKSDAASVVKTIEEAGLDNDAKERLKALRLKL